MVVGAEVFSTDAYINDEYYLILELILECNSKLLLQLSYRSCLALFGLCLEHVLQVSHIHTLEYGCSNLMVPIHLCFLLCNKPIHSIIQILAKCCKVCSQGVNEAGEYTFCYDING